MEIDNEFKEKSKEAVKNGVLYGYCPNHLSVEHREELWLFPLNIMFSKFRTEVDGSQTMGTALYVPDLSTFIQGKEEWVMTYKNQYGGNSYVNITVKIADMSYTGEKFVNGLSVGLAHGVIKGEEVEPKLDGWKLFFFHITMLGLTNGEQCKFEKVN